jgi:ankyrin repeat protein
MQDKMDTTYKDGWTPLMLAVLRGDIALAGQLIADGSDLNMENESGETALWIAIEEEHYGLVEILCKHADVNYKNKEGGTALARAMYQENNDIIELLIRCGGENSGRIPSLDEAEQIYLDMCKEYRLEK